MTADHGRPGGSAAAEGGAMEVSGPADLVVVRRLVGDFAMAAGLVPQRVAGLVLALSEVATNALVHGGGWAMVLMHTRPEAVVVDVRDRGTGAGYETAAGPPPPGSPGGRGLWLAGQVCDHMEVIGSVTGTVVRLVMDL